MIDCPLQFNNDLKCLNQSNVGELSNTNKLQSNFIKLSHFSPDGTQILASTEENTIINVDLPSEVIDCHRYYEPTEYDDSKHNFKSNWKNRIIKTNETIHDMKWYPFMTSTDSLTCCFLSTCKDLPIHLWDSMLGQIRCSYSGYNHLDELDTAISLSFNLTGDRIYAGYNRMIRFFDISYPGRNYTDIPLSKSRRDVNGQKGLVSCIEFNPDHSKAFSVGSYSGSIGIYVEDMEGSALDINDAMVGGLTCMKWSPCGNFLWIGGRNNSIISCWDIRNTRTELGRVNRQLQSNQKIKFDLDPWGKYLVTGNQIGEMLVYNTTDFSLVNTYRNNNIYDCINSVSFHPYSSLLLSSSGQRHFYEQHDDEMIDKLFVYPYTGISLWSIPK